MDTLSIFVDESGRFQYPDELSRFYILGMVFHDQDCDISSLVADLERAESELGLENHCFHAGPLIRQEKGYEFLSRHFRGRILSRMMAFASRVDFKYHCLSVDKRFIDSHHTYFASVNNIKVYYDCGQSPVTNLIKSTFTNAFSPSIEFKHGVKPSRYRLFQIADLVCTLHLIELRLAHGIPMTRSEMRFFGGPRDFKRNILRKIKPKEI